MASGCEVDETTLVRIWVFGLGWAWGMGISGRYHLQMTKIDASIALHEKQIGKLKEYKAVLIDGAVTGKIKIV